MPESFRARAVLGLLLAFSGMAGAAAQSTPWAAPERASKRVNPLPPSPRNLEVGKAVYLKNCLSCHGPAGEGDGPKAKDLAKKPEPLGPGMQSQSDGALFWKITEGRKPMPSFEIDLTPDQIWQVIDYTRSLKTHR